MVPDEKILPFIYLSCMFIMLFVVWRLKIQLFRSCIAWMLAISEFEQRLYIPPPGRTCSARQLALRRCFLLQVCFEYCTARGAAYMATQWGVECWCSREGDLDFDRHGDGGVCDYPCIGDEVRCDEKGIK